MALIDKKKTALNEVQVGDYFIQFIKVKVIKVLKSKSGRTNLLCEYTFRDNNGVVTINRRKAFNGYLKHW